MSKQTYECIKCKIKLERIEPDESRGVMLSMPPKQEVEYECPKCGYKKYIIEEQYVFMTGNSSLIKALRDLGYKVEQMEGYHCQMYKINL